MMIGKDALGWSLGILVLAAFCGCEDAFVDRYGRPVAKAPARAIPAELRAGNDLSPDLRIPGPGAGTVLPARADVRPPAKESAIPDRPAASLVSSQDAAGPPINAREARAVPEGNAALKLRTLYRGAAEQYARINSYIVRLRRREQVNGKDHPEELLLVKFRKNPWSVYFKWLGKEGNGREVVYVQGQYEDKIHTLLATGDIPLMPAGKRIALGPDNALVRSSSRHSIHEAGIGFMIDRFGEVAAAAERAGPRAQARCLGMVSRPDLVAPCEAVDQLLSPGSEPLLPRGGRRLWFFDSSNTKLPVLVITSDETGHEVEYYCYDRFLFPVDLDDQDFNPDKLWKTSRSMEARSPSSR